MSITLVATPASATANSYLSEADAITRLGDSWHAAAWTAMEGEDRKRLLLVATERLDRETAWQGSPSLYDQALAWPRVNAYSPNGLLLPGGTIPELILAMTAELAGYLAAWLKDNPGSDPFALPGELGSIGSMGGVGLSFGMRGDAIPAGEHYYRNSIRPKLAALLELSPRLVRG